MRQYSLITRWHIEAPVDQVWEALIAVEEWPVWWRFVRAVVKLKNGDSNGIGSIRRYAWSSRLLYNLSFDMRITEFRRPTLIEGIAVGDLNGIGRWQLRPDGPTTHVQCEWTVVTTKRWMNLLAPVLEAAFRWNHHQVMAEGGRGLAQHLGVRLLSNEHSSGRIRRIFYLQQDA